MRGAVENNQKWRIDYLGWSGFYIHQAGQPAVFIDPPKGTQFPRHGHLFILITHGHPEHLGGVLDYIRHGGDDAPATIIGSDTVCRFLAGESRRPNVTFQRVTPGQEMPLADDLNFRVFQWRHMPLLPPGLGAASRHIWQLIKGSRHAWRIIRMSLKGPKGPGLMLGYVIHLSDGQNIIVFGEGLHRKCKAEEVADICKGLPGATLLLAAEPEDSAVLPRLVTASGAGTVILYEPHRPWRDIFGLPHADLVVLKERLTDSGANVSLAAGKPAC